MDGLLTVTFEARNPAANLHRWYEVRIGRDLFGEWTLRLVYGRSGQGGQHRSFAAAAGGPLQAKLKEHLRRRLSAPRRIGCAYRLVALSAVAGLDVSAWLPPALMAQLTPADLRPDGCSPDPAGFSGREIVSQ